MKIENIEVYGFKAAIRGMRNPLDSWGKSDSYDDYNSMVDTLRGDKNFNNEYFFIGDADVNLSQILTKAGAEHCKHLRMIQVWFDLTLPRYIWSEFDTYKFNTKVSCSTMHTIHKRNLTKDDFEDRDISDITLDELNELIDICNGHSRINHDALNKTKRDIKKKLPEGFLQKRTVNTNYAELLNIYFQRKNHKLPEWHTLCDRILRLSYFVELTGIEVKPK